MTDEVDISDTILEFEKMLKSIEATALVGLFGYQILKGVLILQRMSQETDSSNIVAKYLPIFAEYSRDNLDLDIRLDKYNEEFIHLS